MNGRECCGESARLRVTFSQATSCTLACRGTETGRSGETGYFSDKSNPDVAQMMEKCTQKTAMPQVLYAESSELARPPMELGPRPPQLPAYWQYKLQDVQIVDCPVVAEASAQGFVLSFQDIVWLNYDPKGPITMKIVLRPRTFRK